jgi:hypothetical protein
MLSQDHAPIGKLKQAFGLNTHDVQGLLSMLLPDGVFPANLWKKAYSSFWFGKIQVAPTSGGKQPDKGRFVSLDTAIGRLGRVVQELGAAIVAFERYLEQQIERARERERSRGVRML